MANYDSNYAIAQEISARIGTRPVPFDSVYSICLAIYQELGGTEDNFDSVYSILLEILPLATEAANVIDDSIITTTKTWSSSKIASELANAGFDTAIVQTLPVSGDAHTIYFVPSSESGATDVYDEYMWIDSQWEKVGSTRLDLSEYEKKVDYTIGLAASTPGAEPTLVLTNLNSATTDGTYTVAVVSNIYGTGDEYFGIGKMVVSNLAAGMIQQNIFLSCNYSAPKQEIVIRVSEDNGASWRDLFMQGALIVPQEYEFFMDNATYNIAKINELLATKQNTLTAGTNITISGNTISATDTTYSAGSGITISGTSVSIDSSLLSEINGKQDTLTAGTNITISGTTISATYEVATTADIEALFS